MSEWWTYSLRDFLLFSPHTYYRLFELYNQALWPLHLLALAIGCSHSAVVAQAQPARGPLYYYPAGTVLGLGCVGVSLAALCQHQLGCRIFRDGFRAGSVVAVMAGRLAQRAGDQERHACENQPSAVCLCPAGLSRAGHAVRQKHHSDRIFWPEA